MPKHKVGDHLLVKLSGGRIVEATVKAVVEHTDGKRLQVPFGNETALIYPWQMALPKFIHFADVHRFGCGIVHFNVHNETHPLVGEPRIGRASNASGPDFDSYFLIPYAFRKH